MGVVEGLILDSSVLLSSGEAGEPTLSSGTDFLFRALQFSQLHKGIIFGEDLSADKVNLLEMTSKKYSFDCFSFSDSAVEVFKNEVTRAWGDVGLKTLYVISSLKKDFCHKLCEYGLLLSVVDMDTGEDRIKHQGSHTIKKLEELPLNICRLNRKVAGSEILTVGYSMKSSRQADFAKRGAFPLCSSQHDMIFLPLTYELSLPLQLQEIDIVLHKATDDIVSIELHTLAHAPKITYTNGMEDLRRTLLDHPHCCVIDPFDNIYPVVDRLKIQDVLLGLEVLNKERCSKIRGPHFLRVDNFTDPNLTERLLEAKLSLPSIVKPQVACGVSSAHSMAIIFDMKHYEDLPVPLPAIVQATKWDFLVSFLVFTNGVVKGEYVDHSSTLFKFYVLGEKVFYAVKKSTPNADDLIILSQANQLKPLVFDSLKSLPTADKSHLGDEALDLDLVKDAANWLRRKLDLTVFGFDVVIQEGTGDHVIVDVNYLPSFKEVPDDVAIPAFWEAIRNKFREKQKTNTNTTF